MRERSGPLYDRAAERSGAVSAVWRAAGRPPKVVQVAVGGTGAEGEHVSELRRHL
ncbi:MAG: hypothetical protein ABSA02_24440 [Trebonia sp.]